MIGTVVTAFLMTFFLGAIVWLVHNEHLSKEELTSTLYYNTYAAPGFDTDGIHKMGFDAVEFMVIKSNIRKCIPIQYISTKWFFKKEDAMKYLYELMDSRNHPNKRIVVE